ncbi:MAG: imelysin family protein [Taibaiella sp.]|nr:imelysin family protein [Taibaiella sp.]
MNKLKMVFASVCISLFLYGCNKEKGPDASASDDTFKKSMLANYADVLIQPAYTELQSKLTLLGDAAEQFMANPSAAAQTTLKQPFKEAYIAYEGISALYFGPGAALQLNNSLNMFPTSTSRIETGITTTSYDFTLLGASDSIQGFPALDYLFFGSGAVSRFSDTAAVNRKKYVRDIITRMKLITGNTVSQWTGGYRDNFTTSMQTNVGSAIGNLVNQFAYEIDAMKGPRIGWPLGKQSNGTVFADKCEAYFSGITKDLAIANLTSLKKFYTGGAGSGIDDYLDLLGKQQLNSDILAQFTTALAALQAIPDPMAAAFTGSPATVETAYREVQKLLTLMKTDLPSATAVQITYMDNDGD